VFTEYFAVFRGDYQKIFKDLAAASSDEDAGMESDDGNARKRKSSARTSRGSTGRSRTKECPGCGSKLSVSIKQCPSCDYQFTSKSMLMLNSSQSIEEESQSIREKFLFEPERVGFDELLIYELS
jgi:hypothetical protein